MTTHGISRRTALFAATAVAAALTLAPPAGAQEAKLTLGLPGVPPVFATVLQYTARDAGFFKKYGVDVTLRNFDSGAAAARAVQSGSIDVSLSPTPVIVNMVSNANVEMVSIYGMENPTWVLGSTDAAIKACADVKGQPVAVDSINGARSVALRELIAPCGLKTSDVQEVPMSANVGAAMIAGQVKLGVLHMDDVPVIEEQIKRSLTSVTTMREVNPINHYLVLVATRDALKKNRDAYVRLLAAHIDATRFLRDPKNVDRVAKFAEPTGRPQSVAKIAIGRYNAMEFWANDHDGLARPKIEAVVGIQQRTGGIREGRTPATYDRLIDRSLWQDALKLVNSKK